MVTPLNSLLIYMEHNESISRSEMLKWGKNESRGIIGKMEAMSLVKRKDDEFRLSKNGYEYINNTLENLHVGTPHWDGMWRIGSFSIPEKDRPKRDKFRRFIETLGMRAFFNSLWVSPLDIKSKIAKYVKANFLEKNVVTFEVTQNGTFSNTENLRSAWDLNPIREKYLNFIEKSNEILKSPERSDKYLLKLHIFEFATIVQEDPNLPIEFLPRDWPFYRAKQMYKRLRSAVVG